MIHENLSIPIKKEVANKESIIDNLEKQLILARKLEKVYEKRPNLDEFINAVDNEKFAEEYNKEKVLADKNYVENTLKKIEESNSSFGRQNLDRIEGGFALSEMSQAMIVDLINSGWFRDFKAIMTSEFDDLRVGIDAVIKHKNGGYLGAAFDFTISNQDQVIHEKLDNEWKNNISKGSIPTVKYFTDPDSGKKGKILAPKFIIGISKTDVEELAEAYLNDNQKTLENHHLRLLIVEQIEYQLSAILGYYENNSDNKKFSFATKEYQKIETFIKELKNNLLSEKKHDRLAYFEYLKKNKALTIMKNFKIATEYK